MDIEQLKSATEDQMEMMMSTMMNMDKFPEFAGGAEFSPSSAELTTTSLPHFLDTSSAASSFLNLPSTNISFQEPSSFNSSRWRGGEPGGGNGYSQSSQKRTSMAAMREMIFRIAAMQPIHIDPESVKPPKRRNVKISKDPQSVAARHRRERISERIRILQRLVPGGTKMDTASMLDEAIHYVKFLKTQVQSLERAAATNTTAAAAASGGGIGFPVAMSSGSYLPISKTYQQQAAHNAQHYGDA